MFIRSYFDADSMSSLRQKPLTLRVPFILISVTGKKKSRFLVCFFNANFINVAMDFAAVLGVD